MTRSSRPTRAAPKKLKPAKAERTNSLEGLDLSPADVMHGVVFTAVVSVEALSDRWPDNAAEISTRVENETFRAALLNVYDCGYLADADLQAAIEHHAHRAFGSNPFGDQDDEVTSRVHQFVRDHRPEGVDLAWVEKAFDFIYAFEELEFGYDDGRLPALTLDDLQAAGADVPQPLEKVFTAFQTYQQATVAALRGQPDPAELEKRFAQAATTLVADLGPLAKHIDWRGVPIG